MAAANSSSRYVDTACRTNAPRRIRKLVGLTTSAGRGELRHVAGFTQEPGAAVSMSSGVPADAAGHRGPGRRPAPARDRPRCRFERDARRRDDVELVHHRGHVLAVAEEVHARLQAEFCRESPKPVAVAAHAGDAVREACARPPRGAPPPAARRTPAARRQPCGSRRPSGRPAGCPPAGRVPGAGRCRAPRRRARRRRSARPAGAARSPAPHRRRRPRRARGSPQQRRGAGPSARTATGSRCAGATGTAGRAAAPARPHTRRSRVAHKHARAETQGELAQLSRRAQAASAASATRNGRQ